MIVKVGDCVRLIHTKKKGYVSDYISDQMLKINVDGDEIPVFLDDLEFITNEIILPEKTIHRSREIKNLTPLDLEQKGVYVAFLPIRDKSENILEFQVYLVNNTVFQLFLDFNFKLRGTDIYRCKKEIKTYAFYPLNKFEFDKLNDSPAVNLKFWLKYKVEGKQQHFSFLIKIKPQIFFKKLEDAPLMDQEAYVYSVFKELPEQVVKKKEVQHIEKHKLFAGEYVDEEEINTVQRKAELGNEIDLHIEKLVRNHSGMSNREILKIQLTRCQEFIEDAIIHNVERVYIIHGLGKGKLKNEIVHLLEEYDAIKSFNNSFHPRYGYGATEVILH